MKINERHQVEFRVLINFSIEQKKWLMCATSIETRSLNQLSVFFIISIFRKSNSSHKDDLRREREILLL